MMLFFISYHVFSFYASIQFHSHHEYCTTSSAKRNSNSERRMNKIEYDIDFVPKQNAIC